MPGWNKKNKPAAGKGLATVIVLTLGVGSVFAGRILVPSVGAAPHPALERRFLDRSKGDPKAPLWIVEYSDFQCKKCAESAPLIESYLRKYPSEIFFQTRFFPLVRVHRFALKASIYAECAMRQRHFWDFHRLLFEKQSEWPASKDPDALFEAYARSAGMKMPRLRACVKDPGAKKNVMAEKDKALALGVTATPTFFVNGKKIVGPAALKQELDTYFEKRGER